uniref:Uncharacterized protein n=1 Tax=Eptatretus burgeri TaxID=7764 RepID=A0A8C4MZJ9_EPTBU
MKRLINYYFFSPIGAMLFHESSPQQYRNSNAGTPTNQSPTSPVSNQGFSPGTSPQTSVLGSIFGDSYYDQSRQATALSHQLEQFNMFENPLGGISLPSGCLLDGGTTLAYSQAGILDYSAAQDIAGKQAAHYNNLGGPIPNIILTGMGCICSRQITSVLLFFLYLLDI